MPEVKRTQFAMKALSLADMFGALVGAKPLDGPVKYKVEMATPDGPSTGGGAQAVQHINLIPEDGSPTVVCGSANQMEKSAELRTYDRLLEQHSRRNKGTELILDTGAYEQLLGRMEQFFKGQGFAVTRVDSEQKLVIRKSVDETLLDKVTESAVPPSRTGGPRPTGSIRSVAPSTAAVQPSPVARSGPAAGFQELKQPSPGMGMLTMAMVGLAIFLAGVGAAYFLMQ